MRFLIIIFTICFVIPVLADVSCNSGFAVANVPTVNIQPTIAGGCNPGYNFVSTDSAYFISTRTTCPVGQYLDGDSCVTLTRGVCAASHLEYNVPSSNITQPVADNCASNYNHISTDSAYFIPDTSQHCAAGYYKQGDTCVAYSRPDDCPSGYYTVPSRFIRADSNNECSSEFNMDDSEFDYCRQHIDGTVNHVCTPQRICNSETKTLKTTDGHAWQLYADVVTSPALMFKLPDDNICNMNLLPGVAPSDINIQHENNIYHGVKL